MKHLCKSKYEGKKKKLLPSKKRKRWELWVVAIFFFFATWAKNVHGKLYWNEVECADKNRVLYTLLDKMIVLNTHTFIYNIIYIHFQVTWHTTNKKTSKSIVDDDDQVNIASCFGHLFNFYIKHWILNSHIEWKVKHVSIALSLFATLEFLHIEYMGWPYIKCNHLI